MTRLEAIALLEHAPKDDKPSRINPSITRRQAVDIVSKCLQEPCSEPLVDWLEKRVKQVAQDRNRPA